MNKIRILLFATLRERAGHKKFIEVTLKNNTNVGMLKAQVALEYPTLASSMKSVLVTINREYATDEMYLSEGGEIAMFPPVSGG